MEPQRHADGKRHDDRGRARWHERLGVLSWEQHTVVDSAGGEFPHPRNPAGEFPAHDMIKTYDSLISEGKYVFRNYLIFRWWPSNVLWKRHWEKPMRKAGGAEGINLPDARALKQISRIPVLEAYRLGAVDYLIKPLVAEIVLAKVAGFVELSEAVTRAERQAEQLRLSEERYRILVEQVQDYAIYLLDPEGHILTWNVGAERMKGYRAEEIIGRHFSLFFSPEEVAAGKPQRALQIANPMGKRGLGEMESPGGPAEAPGSGNGLESLELDLGKRHAYE